MAVLLPTYRMMIHWIVTASVPKLSVMFGSATFTVMSSDVRNIPDAAETRPIHWALDEILLSLVSNMLYVSLVWMQGGSRTAPTGGGATLD